MGPSRYTEIARRYEPLSRRPELLAIDLNIVERYQDVYPTRQQTGGELVLLIRRAAEAFPRTALYFENSIMDPDWPLISAAAAPGVEVKALEQGAVEVKTAKPVHLPWTGCAEVGGMRWPVGGKDSILLPAGRHTVRRCAGEAARPVEDLNAVLLGVERTGHGWRIRYESRPRAIVKTNEDNKPAGRRFLPAGKGQFEIGN